jgi:hypothetical protein
MRSGCSTVPVKVLKSVDAFMPKGSSVRMLLDLVDALFATSVPA